MINNFDLDFNCNSNLSALVDLQYILFNFINLEYSLFFLYLNLFLKTFLFWDATIFSFVFISLIIYIDNQYRKIFLSKLSLCMQS